MAKTTSKVGNEMSEDRVENGGENGGNGWLTFTLSAVDPDYDIICRVHQDYFEGCDPGSVFRLANRNGYGHVISNEAAAAAAKYDGADKEAFLKKWRLEKRQAIIDGEYTTRKGGPRGPRVSEYDRALRLAIIGEVLKPLFADPKQMPKNGKDLVNGQTWDYWIDAVAKSEKPEHITLRERVRVDVAGRQAAAESAKASAAGKTVEAAFASLLT